MRYRQAHIAAVLGNDRRDARGGFSVDDGRRVAIAILGNRRSIGDAVFRNGCFITVSALGNLRRTVG